MKKYLLPIILFCLCNIAAHAQTELLKNPSFEEEAKPIRNRRFGPNGEGELFGGRLPEGIIPGWIPANSKGAASKMEITTENLLDESLERALRWSITEATATAPAAIANVGIHGIEVVKGSTYTLTFRARADKRYKGPLQIGLQSKSADATWYAKVTVKGKIKKRWKKYTVTFTADEDARNARLVITADRPGTLYLDSVSLTVNSLRSE
ncbi:MAG: carbohydrate binding domain-containing protein [Bacteroidaceae bacterium]|nr:carbohydrate binding domain-containing protein [Bacteroidaceae bacterium]